MTRLTFASGTVAGSALVAALVVTHSGAQPDLPTPPTSAPSCSRIDCKFVPSDAALRLKQTLERRGFVCTGKARLAESVVVDLAAGAKVVPFDRALQIGQQGAGWLRSYCSQP